MGPLLQCQEWNVKNCQEDRQCPEMHFCNLSCPKRQFESQSCTHLMIDCLETKLCQHSRLALQQVSEELLLCNKKRVLNCTSEACSPPICKCNFQVYRNFPRKIVNYGVIFFTAQLEEDGSKQHDIRSPILSL